MPRTTFDPGLHAFAFANSFRLTDAERGQLQGALATAIDGALTVLGPLGVAARIFGIRDQLAQALTRQIPESYGLCGGMAFAALDYFRAGRVTPRGNGPTDQPLAGSTLRMYLWRRLVEGWLLNGAVFLEWIARLHYLPARWPFDGGPRALRDRSRTAWRQLQTTIDTGTPVPLGLVGETTDPFLDHQVLAYGYERTSDLVGVIYVYDMNCPGGEQTIQIDLTAPRLTAIESCPRLANPLCGFFCEVYAQATPP